MHVVGTVSTLNRSCFFVDLYLLLVGSVLWVLTVEARESEQCCPIGCKASAQADSWREAANQSQNNGAARKFSFKLS